MQVGLDVLPTILDLAKIPKPEDIQGLSLLPILNGINENRPNYAVSTYNGCQFGLYCQRMIISNNIKYIWNLTDIDELYDLKIDTNELNNLISNIEYSEILKELKEKLYFELERCNDRIILWTRNQLLDTAKTM